jgi:hypothetical protein
MIPRAGYAANGKILVSQKKANTRPIPPITIPTLSISLVLIRPVENAIALGGVEIGINIASEAQVATKQIIAFSPPKLANEGFAASPDDTAQRIGIRRAAVAELLMKFESK